MKQQPEVTDELRARLREANAALVQAFNCAAGLGLLQHCNALHTMRKGIFYLGDPQTWSKDAIERSTRPHS